MSDRETILGAANRIADFEASDGINPKVLEALRAVGRHVGDVVGATDPVVVPPSYYTTLMTALTGYFINQLESYVSNGEAGHLENALTNREHVFTALAPFATLGPPGWPSDAHAEVARLRSSVGQQIRRVEEEVAAALADVETERAATTSSLGDLKAEINATATDDLASLAAAMAAAKEGRGCCTRWASGTDQDGQSSD